ncbi:ABC transporter ATP-binding protein [Virgibacillus proomii]|jgi:ABC-2 type transport system ATP-binding protein|uniref:ABC transporter ATP-binding protein n=1 Tax=Virgibacillus proomii TaxID=84407 RepID=UPI0009878ABB|nr:ABC transporter ATP-binding protein [Virgibacillus proomii]
MEVALKVDNLNFSFSDDEVQNEILNDVSLEIYKGEIVGILGHNGAGKTTLLNCMTNIYTDFDSGSVTITNDLKIGYVPTEMYIYNLLTPEEFLLFIGRLNNIKHKALKQNILKYLKEFDMYDMKDEYIKKLSFGTKHKLSLIAGIIPNPDILVLDEPMTGYDAKSTYKTKQFLKNLSSKNGISIVMSSHRLDIVQDLCSRIIVLDKGKVLYQGDIKNLIKDYSDNSLETVLLSITK